MEYKDYYKTLGVGKNATEKDIKSAFRKLARKHHPDVNPGDADAERKFKDINEAQEVLSDPEKRRKYDTLGPDWEKRARPQTRPGTYSSTPGANGDFSDFFETLFGQRGTTTGSAGDFDIGSIFNRGRTKRAEPPVQRGSDVEQPIEVSLVEAYTGVERSFSVQVPQVCPTCRGSGLLNDQLCPTCGGRGNVSRSRRLDVKIPPGVRDGSRIRIAGEGSPGAAGGQNGDLFLLVHITPDSRFRRDGNDLYTDVDASVTRLVLGGDVQIPTLTGSVTMHVPPGSANGRTFRLGGQGMPHLKGGGTGDLYAKLGAVLPKTLTDEQINLFRQLEQAGV